MRPVDQCLDLRLPSDVGSGCLPPAAERLDLAGGGPRSALVDIRDDDVGSLLREAEGDRLADARASPRHDGHFAFESHRTPLQTR